MQRKRSTQKKIEEVNALKKGQSLVNYYLYLQRILHRGKECIMRRTQISQILKKIGSEHNNPLRALSDICVKIKKSKSRREHRGCRVHAEIGVRAIYIYNK